MAFYSDKSRQGAAGQGAATSFSIDNSLRFNDDDSPYLSRTPSVAGDARTWTLSFWVKRCNIKGVRQIIFTESVGPTYIRFDSSERFDFYVDKTSDYRLTTTAKYRDTGAWMHFVCALDTTKVTPSDRMNLYVNGEKITDFSTETYPPLNHEFWVNTTSAEHRFGKYSADYLDAYLAEVHFVDGAAKNQYDFGEFDADYKHWKPKEVSGLTYGNNGFYLPFKHDTTAAGFGIVTYSGTGTTQNITGVGFQPDIVWTKKRNAGEGHHFYDSVRGTLKVLFTNTDGIENGAYTGALSSFDSDGFSAGGDNGINGSGGNYVAWCWNMGGTLLGTGDFTQGTIASTCKANTAKGQSIVTFTGTSANATVGHGLSSAPEMVIVKRKDASGYPWKVYHSGIASDAETDAIALNLTDAADDHVTWWNDTAPTASTFSLGSSANHNSGSMMAYCFHSVTGYSSIGSYSGNGSTTGPTVTCGFKPRFVMIKNATTASGWHMLDSDRDPTGDMDIYIYANASSEENGGRGVSTSSTGFQPTTTNVGINASGDTYIYMAFADTREALLWADKSGKGNDWTVNNIDASDEMLDSPTNNFCTISPLGRVKWLGTNAFPTLSNGNLEYDAPASGGIRDCTLGFDSGKWYWESRVGSPQPSYVGVRATRGDPNGAFTYSIRCDNGNVYNCAWNATSHTLISSGTASFSAGDIIAVAADMDTNVIKWYKNNSLIYTYSSIVADTYVPCVGASGTANDWVLNFGQDSSFAGNKTGSGNYTDGTYGDFFYEPPTGFLALCTNNLPEPAVKPQENFNVVAYAGDGSDDRSISVGFQPDFVWLKKRSADISNELYDSVRGASVRLRSNSTGEEETNANNHQAFESNGFQIGSSSYVNQSGHTFVAWNWKAGTSASGTTSGSGTLQSYTASYNADAGFSIVKYVGNATANHKIPHHLGVPAEVVIIKESSAAGESWSTYHVGMDATSPQNYEMKLDQTVARSSDGYWNNIAPTSTVFNLKHWSGLNGSGDTHIAYCFASKEGYSKMGSYIGNASSDGTFVYTGFRPAYVLIKASSTAGESWYILDSERSSYNALKHRLIANISNAEISSTDYCDFNSNGFKIRWSDVGLNGNNVTYIYMAFAEYPTKYTTAR
jgi:hypothetical protein